MEIDLQSLEDIETNDVLTKQLVLVETKTFNKSDGIESIEDFYVTLCSWALLFLKQDKFPEGHKKWQFFREVRWEEGKIRPGMIREGR